jgi:hypothetical protein
VASEGDTAKEGACFCHEVKVTWFSCVPHAPPLSSLLSPLSCARGGVPHELAAISNSISGDPSVETRQKPKRGGRQRICTSENAEFLFCPEEQPGALGRRAKPRAINRIAGYNWFFGSFRYGITGSPDPTSSDRAAWWVTPKPINTGSHPFFSLPLLLFLRLCFFLCYMCRTCGDDQRSQCFLFIPNLNRRIA